MTLKPATVGAMLIASLALAQSSKSFGRMTFHGIAPVNVGMTPPEAEAAIRDTLVRYERTPATESCYLVHPESTPTLLFMIEDGRVVRVETESSDFSTLRSVTQKSKPETSIGIE